MIKYFADIARRCPKLIIQLRSLKAIHHTVNTACRFEEILDMWTYVFRAGLANRNNQQWALKADKLRVRDFVADRIGQQYLIPLLGDWENAKDIDFDSLPDRFILKTNNGCATNVFVHSKATLDRTKTIAELNRALRFPYPELTAQHHYSLIPPRIIAEKLMVEPGRQSLTDYKIHCVNGKPVRIYVFCDRDEKTHFNFRVMAFDPEWNEHPEAINEPFRAAPGSIKRPEQLDEMLKCASALARDEEYARIDFYLIEGKIYFGEITLTPDTAAHPAYPLKAMNPILETIKADRASGRSNASF